MTFDSSTLCARTTAGDAELATPRQGLSLGQRRVLTLLQNPAAVDELAQQNRLEPEKLARDLTRLAELRLVLLQGPTMTTDPQTSAPSSPARITGSMAPVVLGNTPRRVPMLPLMAAAAALLLAAGIWHGTRSRDSDTATMKPTSAALLVPPAAIAPEPAPPNRRAAMDAGPIRTEPVGARPVDAKPATSVEWHGSAAARNTRSEPRTGSPGAAQAITKPVATPTPSEQRPAPVPEPSRTAATSAPTLIASGATAATVPADAQMSGSTTVAETPQPVQLAAAAPALTVPRPAAVSALKAISREPPEFPKEAIADGVTTGIVSARIHVDARGNVSSVDILGSQPSRVFDRAVRKALLRWQFEPGDAGQTTDVEVKFQRD